MSPVRASSRSIVACALWALLIASAFALATRPVVAQGSAAGDRRPKLIVLLVVDQFRADYIDAFQHQWSRGLHRLITDGAWFRQAYYPYFNTVTCPGHVSISTGAVPSLHGVILNNWWDRTTSRIVTCTEDDQYKSIGYGRPDVVGTGESLARIQLPTLADELRAQRSPAAHAIAFSLKPRSAVTLGGRKPDAVVWLEDTGIWTSSTAFASGPVPAVAEFLAKNPIEHDLGKTWDASLAADAYLFENPAFGLRRLKGGMTPSLPHILTAASDKPDQAFYDQWQSSPFADEYLAKMALSVAESMGYATLPGPNLLAIGLSTLDKVGHDYGPNSHEVQEILIRLDKTLGDLFTGLDRLVGAGRYTVALTADHGIAPVPERSAREGLDAGRVRVDALLAAAEESMLRTLGAGKHVTTFVHNYVYLESGIYDRLQTTPNAMHALMADLAKVPGVLRTYTRDDLETDRFVGDAMGHQAALSYFAGRSGDLMIAWKPNWIESASTTTHGTGYQYDTHVPVLMMGTGIAKGEYLALAAPTDVAPTLAFLAGVTLPRASGRVLIEALTRPSASDRPSSQGGGALR